VPTPGSFGDPIIIDETIETFSATADLAHRSAMTFAQFVPLTPFPGTVDFEKWENRTDGASA
jgi:hypothetical protein